MATMAVRGPAPDDGPNDLARKIVGYLRQHASYLTPSQQCGRPALAAGVVRGLVSTLLPYLAVLTAIFGLMTCAGFFAPLSDWAEYLPDWAKYLPPTWVQPDPLDKPSFHLALIPAALTVALAALLLLSFLGSSIIAGLFYGTKASERKPEAGYEKLIWFYGWTGRLQLIAILLAVGSTLPWVHGYLGYLMNAGAGGLPANFAALIAAVGGALGLIGRLRGLLAGEKAKPSPLKAAGMALAGFVFIYALLLLSYGASVDMLNAKWVLDLKPAGQPWSPFIWPSVAALVAAWCRC
jgi:hypothetical protein